MTPMALTTERLFRSGEFAEQDDKYLFRKYGVKAWPNRFRYAGISKTAVAVIYQSLLGNDYPLNNDVVPFLLKMKELNDTVIQAYITMVIAYGRSHRDPELMGQLTVHQMKGRLNGAVPIAGKFGSYHWIDKDGNVLPNLSSHEDPTFDPTRQL